LVGRVEKREAVYSKGIMPIRCLSSQGGSELNTENIHSYWTLGILRRGSISRIVGLYLGLGNGIQFLLGISGMHVEVKLSTGNLEVSTR